MALQPTDKWTEAAVAGTAEPLLLFEFRPTVAYAELNCRADWSKAEGSHTLDTAHPSDELRLRRNREVACPQMQAEQTRAFHPTLYRQYFGSGRVLTNAPRATLVQTLKVGRSFKLSKLYLGLRNEAEQTEQLYQGRLRVKLLRGLIETPAGGGDRAEGESHVQDLLGRATEFASKVLDFSLEEPAERVVDKDGSWLALDFSRDNVWVPGGDEPLAIVLEPENFTQLATLKAMGSSSAGRFSRGSLYLVDPETGAYSVQDGDISFKFIVDGHAASGGDNWLLDLGQAPPPDAEGELQLRYCEPAGTRVEFQMLEADNPQELELRGPLRTVSDGSKVTRRFVRIRVTLYSDPSGADTPRVFSIRVAFRRKIRWLLASRPLFGYPNLVAEAPDYSAEGEPLAGEASATDTSRIVLLDPGGMAGGLFSRYSLKNDEVKVYLGFAARGFHGLDDPAAGSSGDWLAFKSVWIEDWEPGDGIVTVHCYDQQVRFRQAQAPAAEDPPGNTERIFYDALSPAAIKNDLLRRAGVRPVDIDFNSGGSGSALAATSFGRLDQAFGWKLNHEIGRAVSLAGVDSELNRHLLAFQLVDERGKWVAPFADFDAGFDPALGWTAAGEALPTIAGDDVLAASERYSPGLKYLRNYGVVFFGGSGSDETAYAGVAVSTGSASAKSYQEHAADKLLSEFIPAEGGDCGPRVVALTVASRRRTLQQDGLRTLEFTTALRFAGLQIGDHVNFHSRRYGRPGALAPNPLLVMLTRKNIDRNLSSIHWAGVVLLDAEQTAGGDLEVAPPTGLTVTPGGDGTLEWQWEASADDSSGGVARYQLFQRLSHLLGWGPPLAWIEADGSSAYFWQGSAFDEALQYDFAVRAVHHSGVASTMAIAENVVLTGPPPSAPGPEDWELNPAPGGIKVWVNNQVTGASHYVVYVWTGLWQRAGSFRAGIPRSQAFVYPVPEPYERRPYQLTLAAANSWGESAKASPKIQVNQRLADSSLVLAAPAFDSVGGTYPLVSRVPVGPYQAFSIMLKIVAAEGEEDLVSRYELERRDDGGTGGENWSEWQRVPAVSIRQEDAAAPAPKFVYYDNTDRKLKPDYYYQYRCRAVSRSGRPGLWSQTATLLLTEDATPPDRPVVTVESQTGRNLVTISEPAIGGGPCPDFSHFVIEGFRQGTSGWVVLAAHYRGTAFAHAVPDGDLESDWKYRATAWDHSGNASSPSLESAYKKIKKAGTTFLADEVVGTGTPGTLSQITQNANEISLKVGHGEVINSINVSTEGIRIQAGKLTVSGSTEFAGGYDPATKLAALGGSYDSASSGPRVRIFPDSGTGMLVTDGASEVFKVLVGGSDVGDVIIGSAAGQHVKWDQSAGELRIQGTIGSTSGLVTGSENDRLEIGKGGNKIELFADGQVRARLENVHYGTGDDNPYLVFESDDVWGGGGTYFFQLFGAYFEPAEDFSLGLPRGQNVSYWVKGDAGDGFACLGFDTATLKLVVKYNGNVYTWTKD